MQYMNKLFYNLGNHSNRNAKAQERMNYDSAIIPKLKIKPINQSKEYDLYYIPTMKTIGLISKISKDDIVLMRLYENLPYLGQGKFLIDMVSSELHSTNLIEGVRSSKEELAFTTKEVLESTTGENRNLKFYNVIKSYRLLQTGDLKRPEDVKDIRRIYDEITVDGVEEEDFPDGKYFRKKETYVYTSSLEEIHRGITSASGTEEYIALSLNQLLNFINNDSRCNELVENAIFHYYFGYIHPFYDGNGRTARFISSIYLKENYSWLTSLSLSQGTNENRALYLRTFKSTNDISMQGELNYFVDSFLEILNTGQNILIDNLQRKTFLLEEALEKIENDSNINKDEDLLNIMKVAIQLHLFGQSKDYIDVNLLIEQDILNYTNQTIRKKLNYLYEMKLLNKTSKNPIRYILNPKYLEE